VNTYDFLVGMNEPLGMILVMTPPTVSIPNVKGVASIITNSFSVSSPQMIPP